MKEKYKQYLKKAYRGLGELLHLKAEFDAAIKYFQKEIQLTETAEAKSGIMREIADILIDQGKYAKSLKTLMQAEEEIKKAYRHDDTAFIVEKAAIRTLRCWAHRMVGNIPQALKEGTIALDLLRRCKMESEDIMTHKSNALNSLGGIYFLTGDNDRAVVYYNQCLNLEKKIGNKRNIAVANNNLANVHTVRDNPEKAIPLARNFLMISEEIGDKNGIAIAYEALGCMQFACEDYGQAAEFFINSLRLAEEMGSKPGISSASNNLGLLYYATGEYEKAWELFKKDQDISRQIGEKRGQVRALTNISAVLIRRGRLGRAKALLSKSIRLLLKMGDRTKLHVALLWLAEAVASGKIKKKDALKYVKKALDIARKLDSRLRTANCHLTYGKVYTALNSYKKGKKSFDKAIAFYGELKQMRLTADVYVEMAKLLLHGGTKGSISERKAVEYFRKARGIYKKLNLPRKIEEIGSWSRNL